MSPGGVTSHPVPTNAAPVLRRVEAVVNPAAGGVGPGAADAMAKLLSELGLDATVRAALPENLQSALQSALDTAPDLLIVLAGDGTARIAASLCGAAGPLIAPLAGGTMNMLPHALYGPKDWKTALRETVTEGVITPVSGGEIEGRRFHVAALLGAPALWAEAREAARQGRFDVALRKGQNAWRRAFASRLHFSLDAGEHRRSHALTLMCPLVSRAMANDEGALEVDVLDPKSAAEAFRLGFRTLMSEVVGDWRDDPAVNVGRCLAGEAWARAHIPAIIDGEPVRLHKRIEIRFIPVAFRALAPPRPPGPPLVGRR